MGKWHDFLEDQISVRPDAIALTDNGGACWSFAAFGQAVSDLVAELQVRGVRPYDRVMIVCENCCAAIAALFACSRIGACAVPVNARQTQGELMRIIEHARPAVVLLTTAASPDATQHAGRMTAEALVGSFGQFHVAAPFASAPDADLDDVAVMLFTTGTTGTPKGVMLTHDNVRFGGMTSANLRGMTREDVVYGVLPITHVFGLCSVVTAASYAGAQVRLEARFSAARLYDQLRDGVTLFSAVPQMHALLMQYAKEQGVDGVQDCALRYTSSGAAPLDPAWKRKAEAFYGVPIQNGYGLTESTAGVSASNNDLGDPDISVGKALPGVKVRIDETVEGGSDGIGEVLTAGPHVMKGYYRNAEATDAALQDGWLRTGDLGYFDEHGRLHIAGRSKELIIHGGFNVYPPEVEAALNDHPQVIQSAVIGCTVEGDELVYAFVQAAKGDLPDVEDLKGFAAARLAGYKRPSRIVVATELPAAPTGKILKHRLLDHFADQLG
ncbi:Long-chain-fatty-acid--CoA ligase [Falsiruegeria litorea R37]|uniref:Long-chain-fatty-acid--CoA ligase n=1 Tax=Falsiruegeria litorea R37 TaxID=1200284 RepID=A0A1Y5RR14_9RHOB|nr:class I adenylate-forming enzyme family protein [Falsiruegeria litorea]SLN23310.1 Long-chain-fatty-acid--CoA ligase [Falsiruegeria litorea R37]